MTSTPPVLPRCEMCKKPTAQRHIYREQKPGSSIITQHRLCLKCLDLFGSAMALKDLR